MTAPDTASKTDCPGHDRFTVRAATPDDIPALLALERATPSAAHWAENAYLEIFAPTGPERIALVLEDEARGLSGFIIARFTHDQCELENIAVAQGRRRRGLGTRLVHALLAAAAQRNCRHIFLEVRESSAPARSLYAKCGFEIIGRRPRYYSNPLEDAVLYSAES